MIKRISNTKVYFTLCHWNTIRQRAFKLILLKDADTSSLRRYQHDKMYCLPWVKVVVEAVTAR